MSTAHTIFKMDLQTFLSMAGGVIFGGLITWGLSFYYARRSAKDMKSLIEHAANELARDIPKEAAHKVIENQLISNVLAAGPLAFKILSKLAESAGKTPPRSPQTKGPDPSVQE